MPASDHPPPPSTPRSWWRWFAPRYSLRTILIVITLLCVAMGLPYNRAERQRNAAMELSRLNCGWSFAPEPKWVSRLPESVREYRDGHYFRSIQTVNVNHQAKNSIDRIIHALAQVDSVERIVCTGPPITYEHLAQLSRLKKVRELLLSRQQLDDGALYPLRNWKNLEVIHLSHAGVTEHGIAYLKNNSKLKRIALTETYVGDGIGDSLQAFPNLEYLELGRTNITSAGVARLPRFQHVKGVDLSHTLVDDRVVETLAHFPKLESIDLAGTQVTDTAGKAIASWGLKRIRLTETAITDATLDALRESAENAPFRRALESLEIQRTKCTLGGISQLRALPVLTSVGFYRNNFDRRMLRALAAIESPVFSYMAPEGPLSREEWQMLVGLRVKFWDLTHCDFDDEILEQIARSPDLQRIGLKGATFGQRGLAAVAGNKMLQYVGLANTSITAADFTVFESHPGLMGVSIEGSPLGDDILPTLLTMPSLRSLVMGKDQFSYEALRQLHEKRVHVNIDNRTVEFNGIGELMPGKMLRVPKAWPLQSLRPESDEISALAERYRRLRIVNVNALDYLSHIDLSEHEITDDDFVGLHPFPNATHFFLRGRGLTDKTLGRLAERPRLEFLSLSEANVTPDGLRKLARLPLHSLHLKDIPLADDDLAFLDDFSRLEHLSLDGANITDASLPRLATLNRLITLNINGTRITPKAARESLLHLPLANLQVGQSYLYDHELNFLRGRSPLDATDVTLQGPCFDDESLARLGDHLWLREIDLTDSFAGDATLEAMRDLTDLREVELKGTTITDAGLAFVAKWKNLRRLDLSNTAITEAGLKHLDSLPQLRWLDARGTKVTPAAIQLLQAARPWLRIDGSPAH